MRKLRLLRLLSLSLVVAAAGAAITGMAACGDDSEDNLVRTRPDASDPDAIGPLDEAGLDTGIPNTCGIQIPATYVSPAYDTNAAVELALRNQFDALLKPMKDAEIAFTNVADGGAAPAAITKAQLDPLYIAGTPSVRSITSPFFQGKVDGWFVEYEEAFTAGAWTPKAPVAGDKGGVYSKWVFSETGIDLRQALEKGTYIAGFYNHALGVVASGAPTEATVDRLIAAFGAHPTFPGDPAAAQNKDVNSASYAARRSRDPALTGPYSKIKTALITAKASIAAGEKCNADRDAALKVFFAEWERSNYATVVYYFNDIISTKLPGAKYADALHSYGEGIGFISGFRTLPQDQRIITDAQIDQLLERALAPNGAPAEAYKLETESIVAGARLQEVITTIKTIYNFSDAEIASFKKFN